MAIMKAVLVLAYLALAILNLQLSPSWISTV